MVLNRRFFYLSVELRFKLTNLHFWRSYMTANRPVVFVSHAATGGNISHNTHKRKTYEECNL